MAEDGGGGGGMLYGGHGGSNMTSLIQYQRIPSSSQPLDPFFISGSSPSLLGSSSMVSFEDLCNRKRPEGPFFCTFDEDENRDDDFDPYFHQPEKKRRLTTEQVRFLERSFETENKLEPERKSQLAKDLGLQPRQVAIWFQNRRARWKTKQLEKDFGILQAKFDNLKAEYDILLQESDKLKAEVLWLSDKLQLKAKEKGETELQITASSSQEPTTDPASEEEASRQMLSMVCKKEDPSSATSDVHDSDSPHYVDGPDSSAFPEPINSVYELEPFNSERSQDNDDSSLNPTCLSSSAYVLPKIEIFDDYPDDPPPNSCHLASLVEDQDSWFWSY